MPALAIVGAQWGDEGKGKITDVLSGRADAVVRAQGGANAGHTVVVGSETFKLHILPSGVLREDTLAIVGPGCVVDPDQFLKEVQQLEAQDALNGRLVLSDRAHVVLPIHKALDAASEKSAAGVGSTKRGIGPTYAGKAARANIRIGDLVGGLPDGALDRIEQSLGAWLTGFGEDAVDTDAIADQCQSWGEALDPYVDDSTTLVHEVLEDDGRVVLEGAQGVLLDIDHGTYPFVTSSAPSAAGLCAGSGVPPGAVDGVLGIVKAYTTRVGDGPFPSEIGGTAGDHLVEVGHEFGTTTGRRRRVGWLDLVALKYAARINGLTHIAAMKIDVLEGLDEVHVCTAYEIDGTETTEFPARADVLARAQPVFEPVEGSFEGVGSARSPDHLPGGARRIIEAMEAVGGCPVAIASVGPGRDQTVSIRPIID